MSSVQRSISEQLVDEAERLRAYLESGERPLTHLVAIERVAPGSDGRPHREHGWDMSRETAPLHLLFDEPGWHRPWTTIGIGDGGNEIGMAALPKELVERDIPNGLLIAARTTADHLIVAGVSNWGAYGLLAESSPPCVRTLHRSSYGISQGKPSTRSWPPQSTWGRRSTTAVSISRVGCR